MAHESLPVHSYPVIHHSLLPSDRCSSTSSVENSKPQRKLGRSGFISVRVSIINIYKTFICPLPNFLSVVHETVSSTFVFRMSIFEQCVVYCCRYEYSSSDAMSIDQNSSAMDYGGSSSHSINNHSLTTLHPSNVPLCHSQSAAAHSHTLGVNYVASTSSTLSYVTSATCSASVSTDSHISGPTSLSMPCGEDISKESLYSPTDDSTRQQPNHLTSHSDITTESTIDSLRWSNVCSDEEKELERIKLYKENRRKRYEDALQQRRTQQSQLAGSKYYTIDNP